MGERQKRVMAMAKRDGVFRAKTAMDYNSALRLHDRGLLDRGEDSMTFLPKGNDDGSTD